MTIPKKKIEVFNVDLDINLEEEIKKHSTLDTHTKSKIASVLNNAPKNIKPMDPIEQQWNSKFDKLFDAMSADPNTSVTKLVAIDILGIPVNDLGLAIAKFKKYLRIHKENKWVVLTGQDTSRQRIYTIKRFA